MDFLQCSKAIQRILWMTNCSFHRASITKIQTWLARWTGSAFRLGIGRTAYRTGIGRIPTDKLWNTESDSMTRERQKLDSTRWAWPPVDRGDSNTSVQWSTVACHQVVFACAFGAVSTTPGETCCSNMKTGATIILLSAHLLGAMNFENKISIGLIEVNLSMMACKSHVHMHDIRNFYLFWFVTLSREHVCSLGMLECPNPAHEKVKNAYSIFEPCK